MNLVCVCRMCEYWRITPMLWCPTRIRFPRTRETNKVNKNLSHLELVSLLTGLTPTVWPWWRHYFVHFYIDPILKWLLYSNTFCIIQSSNVIVFHIHIHVLLQAHSIHIRHRKHANTQTHTYIHTYTPNPLHTPHTNSPQREICVSVYGCVMVMQCLRCTQASLKDLKYCKGVIKPNFTYTCNY